MVEYAGAAVAAMSMEGRMTLCNLNIEMGGRSGVVAPDDATFQWIAGRPFAPKGAQWDAAMAYWRTLKSDRLNAGSNYSIKYRWSTPRERDVRVLFRGDRRNIRSASVIL